MDKVQIKVRSLKEEEINLLIEEIAKFPNPAYFSKNEWKRCKCIYIISVLNHLAGVCVAYNLGSWVKLGPLVILEKYQGKGLGKLLLGKITEDYINHNIYIGSHNPKVGKIVEKLGYQKLPSTAFIKLPKEIIFYYLRFFLRLLNVKWISEIIRKKIIFKEKNRYYFYFRYS